MKEKVKLQCGWENDCREDDCVNCRIKHKITIEITHAELTAIENFGICDLPFMFKEKRGMIKNMQRRCWDLQKKIYEEI